MPWMGDEVHASVTSQPWAEDRELGDHVTKDAPGTAVAYFHSHHGPPRPVRRCLTLGSWRHRGSVGGAPPSPVERKRERAEVQGRDRINRIHHPQRLAAAIDGNVVGNDSCAGETEREIGPRNACQPGWCHDPTLVSSWLGLELVVGRVPIEPESNPDDRSR